MRRSETTPADPASSVTAALLPLARSLRRPTKTFDLFEVLRHGRHERNWSNLLAWLLSIDGTHRLGALPQECFIAIVKSAPSLRAMQSAPDPSPAVGDIRPALPDSGYSVRQEQRSMGRNQGDIVDILLAQPGYAIVIENYYVSDPHKHNYTHYQHLATHEVENLDPGPGATNATQRTGLVVMVSHTSVPTRMTDDWENVPIVTFTSFAKSLRAALAQQIDETTWRAANPGAASLLDQFFSHCIKEPDPMHREDQIELLAALSDVDAGNGVLAAGQRDHLLDEIRRRAALEIDALKELFTEARTTLLAHCITLAPAGEPSLDVEGHAQFSVIANFSGTWLCELAIAGPGDSPYGGIVFGPTAAEANRITKHPLRDPDFHYMFLFRRPSRTLAPKDNELRQTAVPLASILDADTAAIDRLIEELVDYVRGAAD